MASPQEAKCLDQRNESLCIFAYGHDFRVRASIDRAVPVPGPLRAQSIDISICRRRLRVYLTPTQAGGDKVQPRGRNTVGLHWAAFLLDHNARFNRLLLDRLGVQLRRAAISMVVCR